jgi:hypothetical protein
MSPYLATLPTSRVRRFLQGVVQSAHTMWWDGRPLRRVRRFLQGVVQSAHATGLGGWWGLVVVGVRGTEEQRLARPAQHLGGVVVLEVPELPADDV